MAYKEKSDAIRYNNNYIKQAYDRINLTVPKGQKEVIEAAAKRSGDRSVNGFINRLIADELTRLGMGGSSGIEVPSVASD